MRRSKLQIYVAVLDALAVCGPMKLTRITYKANLSHNMLKPVLKYLIENGLVEVRKLDKNIVVYAATNTARKTLIALKEFSQVLPLI